MALLTIQDLSPGYDSHAIVEHLNFSVNTGDYLCIVAVDVAAFLLCSLAGLIRK